MRLINTTSIEFHSGEHKDFCKDGYAVLSHRWVPQEITLDQLGNHVDKLRSGVRDLSPQLDKIRGAVDIARSKDIKWVWIDSCCIDKRDLVETTESINAMYKWYHNSTLCIVYLYDVKKNDAIAVSDPHAFDRLGIDEASEWFYRGWTLQELLAPREMEFYDKEWAYMGTKKELKTAIGNITGIDEDYLTGEDDFRKACIAQKMSWMAKRITTKEEDIAYSMVGLFGITMTPIYGEGLKAFMRLQEILLSSRFMDESLFAWKMPALGAGDQYKDSSDPMDWAEDEWGLLAPSPEWFAGSADVRTWEPFHPRQESFSLRPRDVLAPTGRSPFNTRVSFWTSTAAIGFILGIIPGIIAFYYSQHLVKKQLNKDRAFKLHCFEGDGRDYLVAIYLRPVLLDGMWRRNHVFSQVSYYKRVRCTEFGSVLKTYPFIRRKKPGFILQPAPEDT